MFQNLVFNKIYISSEIYSLLRECIIPQIHLLGT